MPDDTLTSPDFDLFFKAVIRGDFEDVKKRYEDKYLTMTNGSGWTPLHRACYQGSRVMVSYLLDKGADIEAQTYLYLWRPLHCAAYYGQPDAVTTLIERGCSLEGITERKETAYDMAKRESKEDCAVILKEAKKIRVLLQANKSYIEDKDLLSVLTNAIGGHYDDIRKEKLPPVMYKIVETFDEVYKKGIFDKVLKGEVISSILKSKMDCLKTSVNLLGQPYEDSRPDFLYDTMRAYLKDLRDVCHPNHEVTSLTETFLMAMHDLHRGGFRNFDGDTIETLRRCFTKYAANKNIRTLAGYMIVAAINVGTAGSTTEGNLTKEDINEVVCYLKVTSRKGEVSTTTTTTKSFTAGPEEEAGLERAFKERWRPSITDYHKVALVDDGSYGDINLCVDTRTNERFVIKEIEIHPGWKEGTNYLEKEIKKWANLCYHRRTVRYFGSVASESAITVFMEFVSWGSLRTRLDESGVLSPSVVGKFSLQILEGLNFLHDNGIVHGDLKASNILVEDKENIKLSDFNIFECLKRRGREGRKDENDDEILIESKIKRSWYWMAPEVVRGGDCSHASDVWSVGATLVEMLTGNPPYHNIALDDFQERMRTSSSVDYRSPQDVPPMLQSFIASMLAPDPQERPDVKTLLRCPFIRLILVPSLDASRERYYLGEGSYGAIWKGLDSESGLYYLVKEICTDKYQALNQDREVIKNLIQGYAQLQGHEYVVRYFGVTSTSSGLDIFMEYVAEGSLKTKMDLEGPFEAHVVTEYIRQIIEALHFLHGQDIIHKDIRAANVLQGEGGRVKLGDFGFSSCLKTRTIKYRPESSVTLLLSPSFFWMAPEVLESGKYSKKSDMWSLGATMFEMLTGNPPNHNLSPFAVMEKMNNPDIPKCDFPDHVTSKIKAFIKNIMNLCAKDRLMTEELLQSPFIHTVQVPSLVYYEKEADVLGRGSLGDVYRCHYKRFNMDFVVKEVPMTDKRFIGRIIKEINGYTRLPINERVLRYFGTSQDEKGLNVFREHFSGKSLKAKLLKEGPLSPDMIARYSKHILEGLTYLHLYGVVHGDIRGSNVIVEDNDDIKLCDFGVYHCFEEIAFNEPDKDDLSSHIESICYWKAPEVLGGARSSQWSDIWSFGATVVEMMTGAPPYFNLIPYKAKDSIKYSSKAHYKAVPDTPPSLYALLDSTFMRDPRSRATVQTLLESAFIRDLLVPSIDDYIKEDLLGQGAYGQVYKCFDKRTKFYFAVKEVKINSDGGEVKALNNEINIYKKLKYHERILRYIGTSEGDGVLRIFMEYMPSGSLRRKLDEEGPFPPEVISIYTKQVLDGLDFLHQKKIIHRDIKGENILRVDDNNIKLCDFGVSFILSSTIRGTNETMPLQSNSAERGANTIIGTYYWMAPEVVKGRTYDFSADLWSLGATVVEMLSGNPPFYHLQPMPAIFEIGCTARVRYESPQYVPPALLSFLDNTFVIDPLKRATVQDLLQCDFIREGQIVADGVLQSTHDQVDDRDVTYT